MINADRTHHGTREALTFEVVPPYSLSLTVQVLRRVPANIVDQWAGGVYSRALQIGADEYILRVRQLDQTTLEVDADRSPEAVLPLVRRMLGVDVDLSEALRLQRPIHDLLRLFNTFAAYVLRASPVFSKHWP